MARSGVELDFFNMGKSSQPRTLERKTSFRDIQGLISKINPEVLKTVIANARVDAKKSSQSNVPNSLSLCDPIQRPREKAETAPMTIFYKGKVAVFEVSPHKAQDIMKLAEEAGLHKSAESSQPKPATQHRLNALHGDLRPSRRKSLQSFLEKRKERHAPYTTMADDKRMPVLVCGCQKRLAEYIEPGKIVVLGGIIS